MIDVSQWRASIGLWACCQTSYSTRSKDAPNTESSSRIDGVTIIRKIKDLTFALGVFLSLLLILSGDVELNPGPKTGITSKLCKFPTRYELFQLLNDIRHKWYEIGLSLQISRNVLDDLKHSGSNDELLPVIDKFLITQPSPNTWETVITAIESPIVNDKKTADLIRRYLNTFIPRILKEIPDDLYEQFQFNSDKWYEIGLSLQIHRNLLDDLKKCSWKNDFQKINEVIRIWENTKPSPNTWETVMTAMESPVINSKELAEMIRQKLVGRALYRVRYNPNYFGPTEISDSDANKKLLDKAMKEGYVTVKWTKFSVSGAPGTGKSSFLNLLYNEDPPDCHNSTQVITAKEARIISATVGDDFVWRKIDHKTLKEIIAQGIKHSIRPHQPKESLEESIDHPTYSENFESSTTLRHQSSSFPKPTIAQEITELLPQTQKSEELYQSHWIYGVDTGGQAAFLDIAPALLRYHSVNILTHKLDEKLNDKAKFFFSIKGKQISEPVEKQITNIQLLQSSFCSVLSVDFPKLPNVHIKHVQKPYYIVLGTFLDKMLESSESLETKNATLSTVLEKFREVTIMYRTAGNEVIFPVNTTARNDYEINVAAKIRKKICQYFIEAEIPIRWFLFHLELDELHKFSKSSIISLSKCLEIGMTLQLNSREVHAALMYYHDLTIFLYFPKVLPNIVFLHPQPLFERLSDLISISIADAVDRLEEVGISLYNPAAHEELKDEGTFKEDLLTSPNSHLSQGFYPEFTPQDFLKLMTSLFIMAFLPEEGKYVLPTVLPMRPTINYDSIPSSYKEHVDPLILSWDLKPFPSGIFPALVVNLLHRKDQPMFQLQHFTQHYRNAITLNTDFGNVILVDGIYWMAIYYSGSSVECFTLREAIRTGINDVISQFLYTASIYGLSEYFYCMIPDCPAKASEHFCHLSEDEVKCICQYSSIIADTNRSRQLPWFRDHRDLYEAIKKGGLIEARISKVLIQGPARVGKTSLKCLILSQVYDKPHSTGIAERPQIAFQQFGRNEEMKWELVSNDNIVQMFANEIEDIMNNDKNEKLKAHKDIEGRRDKQVVSHNENHEDQNHGLEDTLGQKMEPISSDFNKDDNSRKTQEKNPQHAKVNLHVSATTRTVSIPLMPELSVTNTHLKDPRKQLAEALNKASGRTEKLKMCKEWLYFIDAGGQIQFQQILQAFIPCASVLMLVISLKEELSSQSCTEFKDEDGTIIVSEHSISIKTLLRRLISMVSFSNQQEDVTSGDIYLSGALTLPKKLKVIAVATHEDEERTETITEKETQLSEIFKSTKSNIHYENASCESILFKVDGRKASEKNVEDEAIAKIRAELNEQSFKVVIPLTWYAFEILLRDKATVRNTSHDAGDSCCGILTLEECIDVGAMLELHKDEINSALKFFHLLNSILYYPPEVTNLVFVDPYSLIQVVNELTILVCKVRRRDNVGSGPYALQQMAKFGIISNEILSNDKLKMFAQISIKFNNFESHLFKIFIHLSLASKLPHYILNDAIFMPALLPLTDPLKGIPCSFLNDTPLLFYFKNGTPVGFFCAMIVNLLSKESKKDDCNGFKWELHEKSTDKFYSNFVVLRDDKSVCTLALVESFDWFEIHSKHCKEPPKVKKAIEIAIADTARKQKQRLYQAMIEKEVEFEIAFYSPCGKETEDGHFHIAVVKNDSELFCNQCDDFFDDSKGSPRISWITCIPGQNKDFKKQATIEDDDMNDSVFSGKPEKLDVLNCLACISSSWYLIGTSLKIKHDDLQSMAQENTNDKKRLSDVLEKWIQMDGQASPVTWHTIIKVIQGPLVEKNDLAVKIFQSLKQKECKQKTTNSKQQKLKKSRKPDSSDSESYDLTSGYDEEPTGRRHRKRSDVNESSSKEHARLLERKRTKDRKQQKQKTSEEYYSCRSESDGNVSSKKQRSHHVSPDSDSESYDVSSRYDDEPTEGIHHKRSDVNESLSKKRLRLLERKRTKDRKQRKQRKQKKLNRSEEFSSSCSVSDRDISFKKQRSHHVLRDSDSESYDVSSRCDEEPGNGRSCKRKWILQKRLSMSSRKQKGDKRHRTKGRHSNH